MRKLVNDRVSLKEYPKPEIVHDLIMQVEASYVYYILKSTMRSQTKDPVIKTYLIKYEIKTLIPPIVDNDGTIF